MQTNRELITVSAIGLAGCAFWIWFIHYTSEELGHPTAPPLVLGAFWLLLAAFAAGLVLALVRLAQDRAWNRRTGIPGRYRSRLQSAVRNLRRDQ